MSKPNITRSLFPAASALILAAGLPISTHAATLQNVYLISSQSSPVNASSPAFGVNGTTVYELTLTGTTATAYSLLGTGLQFNVASALTYQSHTGTINNGETNGTTAAHINQEVGVWDDVGIFNDGGGDALLNVDHSDTAKVIFNGTQPGFLDLIVAEDAGLDDFELSLCSASCNVVFNGLDTATSISLLALSNFSGNDSSTASEMDQAFVFRFSDDGAGVTEDVRIGELNNYGGAALEVDFVGVGGVSFVPIPAAAWLFGSALIGLVGAARRKKAA